METVAVPLNLARVAAHETARWQAIADGERGHGDAEYKTSMRNLLKRRENWFALQKSAADLQGKIDAAVARHAATIAPLGAVLEADDVEAARRVEIRTSVNEANAKLEAEVAPLRKVIQSVSEEIRLLAARGVSPAVVENAFFQSSSPEIQERVRVLRKAEEILKNGPCFSVTKAANDAEYHVRFQRDELKRRDVKPAKIDAALVDLERNARFTREVAGYFTSFLATVRSEMAEIRQRRLDELYRGLKRPDE